MFILPMTEVDWVDRIEAYKKQLFSLEGVMKTRTTSPFIKQMVLLTKNLKIVLSKLENEQYMVYFMKHFEH